MLANYQIDYVESNVVVRIHVCMCLYVLGVRYAVM